MDGFQVGSQRIGFFSLIGYRPQDVHHLDLLEGTILVRLEGEDEVLGLARFELPKRGIDTELSHLLTDEGNREVGGVVAEGAEGIDMLTDGAIAKVKMFCWGEAEEDWQSCACEGDFNFSA